MTTLQIPPHVAAILRKATTSGNVLFLNQPGLPRPDYDATNKVLAAAGGKWDRKAGGHVFPGDPMTKLGLAMETGAIQKEKTEQQLRQAFYTPPALAARVVELAEVSGKTVLEPSAGGGALVREALAAGASYVLAVEENPACLEGLQELGAVAFCADFLTVSPAKILAAFQRVVMNPPFTKNQDVKHVAHALELLADGGRLVAIIAANVHRKAFKDLSAWIKTRGWTLTMEAVPAGAFKESGTNVATLILTVQK
jgi:predicted RNA methylase